MLPAMSAFEFDKAEDEDEQDGELLLAAKKRRSAGGAIATKSTPLNNDVYDPKEVAGGTRKCPIGDFFMSS